jgi:glycosyltransferase involved in cell wall biosynthesis
VRILLDYRPALRHRTGVGEYVHELARALVATAPDGESLVLFSSSWKDRLPPDAVPGAGTIDRMVPVGALNLAWHRFERPAIESLTGRTFDVVQAAHPLLIPSRRAARVVTICDLDFLDHPERTSAEVRRDYPALAASHAQRADQVIVISEHTASEVERRLDVPADRISICVPGAPGWPARVAEPAHGCILFLGTLEPRKNLDVLLDAYERLIAADPAVPSLVLAGRLTAAAEPVARRATRPPLAGRVELTGYVAPDRRLDLYRRALLFVLPSHTEGFGMTAVEAMVVGVPVIAAHRGALPEAVGPAGRLVDPTDALALAEAMRAVLSDAALRERMRRLGWAHAGRFQWTHTAQRAREAWGRALARRNGRRG